jgi:Leucine-rich repeat (LRR) protein
VREALSVSGLQTLDLSFNKLNKSPPETAFRGLQLTVRDLNLFGNNNSPFAYNLSEFAYIPELTFLNLQLNKINSVTSARPLPKLVMLNIDNNDIRYFPQTCLTGNVSIFPSLQKLSAAFNGMFSPCKSVVCLTADRSGPKRQ